MKKRTKILLALLVTVTLAIDIVMFMRAWNNRDIVLANINRKSEEVQTSRTEVCFAGCEGDRIKLSFRTAVQGGEVDFILRDSKGNTIADLDKATALVTYVDLSYDDTYTMEAICEEFTGDFLIEASKRKSN